MDDGGIRSYSIGDIEKIAVDLIAHFLHTDLAPGSGCRERYEQMISLYDKWK